MTSSSFSGNCEIAVPEYLCQAERFLRKTSVIFFNAKVYASGNARRESRIELSCGGLNGARSPVPPKTTAFSESAINTALTVNLKEKIANGIDIEKPFELCPNIREVIVNLGEAVVAQSRAEEHELIERGQHRKT